MKKIGLMRWLMAGAALLALAPAAANAQSADMFKGKTLHISVGYGPGGGYDLYTRILAKHIVKYLPGNPNYVVENVPGAGSAKLATYINDVAPKDGTEFGLINSTIAFVPLFGTAGGDASVKFDPRKLTWLGSLDQFTPIGISWGTTGVKSLEDIKQKEFIVGSTGGDDAGEVYCSLMNTMLGTKFKILAGYKGSNDIALAMERGEVPGFVGWYWAGLNAFKPDWVPSGKVNTFLQLGLDKDPTMPESVPWILDPKVLPKERDRQVFKLVLSQLALARPFIAPPGLPAATTKVLREAFNKTAQDKDFVSELETAKQTIRLYTGEQIDALLKEVYATPPDLVAEVKKAMQRE